MRNAFDVTARTAAAPHDESFSLPDFAILQDADGHFCLSSSDALGIAAALAADPAQPFLQSSSCGFRAELMVGRLVTGGMPADLIHRAHIFAVEGDPNDDTAIAERRVMHPSTKTNPPEASFQALTGEPAAYPATLTLPGTDLKVFYPDQDIAYLQNQDASAGWPIPYQDAAGETIGYGFGFYSNGECPSYGDHVTIALPVLNVDSGQSELKVIDPFLCHKPRLLSFAEWKKMQNCDSAIMMAGAIGKLSDVVTEKECLRPEDEKKFSNCLQRIAPGSDQTTLNRQQAAQVTAHMLNINPAEHPNWARDCRRHTDTNFSVHPDLAERFGFEEAWQADVLRNDHLVGLDWNTLAGSDQNILVERWIEELRPLVEFQRIWQEKFHPETQHDVTSSALSRPYEYVLT